MSAGQDRTRCSKKPIIGGAGLRYTPRNRGRAIELPHLMEDRTRVAKCQFLADALEGQRIAADEKPDPAPVKSQRVGSLRLSVHGNKPEEPPVFGTGLDTVGVHGDAKGGVIPLATHSSRQAA